MANDLAKLYRELEAEKQTPEIKKVIKNISYKLSDRMRDNFLDLLEIGDVIGYDRLDKELKIAAKLVAKMKDLK